MTTIRNQPKQPGGLHAYMEKWNTLAQKAIDLGGIKGVKIHTSEFESYVAAEKRVSWLEQQIKEMEQTCKETTPPAPPVVAPEAVIAQAAIEKAKKRPASPSRPRPRPPAHRQRRPRSSGGARGKWQPKSPFNPRYPKPALSGGLFCGRNKSIWWRAI